VFDNTRLPVAGFRHQAGAAVTVMTVSVTDWIIFVVLFPAFVKPEVVIVSPTLKPSVK